jgi:hypothetical protein
MQLAADADIDDPYRGAARDHAAVARGQEIGGMVQVVGPPGDRRTEVLRRQVPGGDAVVVREQCLVERLDRGGIGEVDRFVAMTVARDEGRQGRAGGDELGEVVTTAMPVPRMQTILLRRRAGRPAGGWGCRWSLAAHAGPLRRLAERYSSHPAGS